MDKVQIHNINIRKISPSSPYNLISSELHYKYLGHIIREIWKISTKIVFGVSKKEEWPNQYKNKQMCTFKKFQTVCTWFPFEGCVCLTFPGRNFFIFFWRRPTYTKFSTHVVGYTSKQNALSTYNDQKVEWIRLQINELEIIMKLSLVVYNLTKSSIMTKIETCWEMRNLRSPSPYQSHSWYDLVALEC